MSALRNMIETANHFGDTFVLGRVVPNGDPENVDDCGAFPNREMAEAEKSRLQREEPAWEYFVREVGK